jgi:streptomycin 6-kinase
VLAAEREPWLVIDPKRYVGDAAYDVTQHAWRTRLLNDLNLAACSWRGGDALVAGGQNCSG